MLVLWGEVGVLVEMSLVLGDDSGDGDEGEG